MWHIDIRGHFMKLAPGSSTCILSDPGKLEIVGAVPPEDSWLRQMALIFDSPYGVRFQGQPARCALVPVGTEGGEVVVERWGARYAFQIRFEAAHGKRFLECCGLCRQSLNEEDEVWECRCGFETHGDCIVSAAKCPVCGTAIDRSRRKAK